MYNTIKSNKLEKADNVILMALHNATLLNHISKQIGNRPIGFSKYSLFKNIKPFDFDLSNSEMKFLDILRNLIFDNKIILIWHINMPDYIVEHLLPIYFTLPGYFAVMKTDDGKNYVEEQTADRYKLLKNKFGFTDDFFIDIPNTACLTKTGDKNLDGLCNYKVLTNLLDSSNKYFFIGIYPLVFLNYLSNSGSVFDRKYINFEHGVDEDPIQHAVDDGDMDTDFKIKLPEDGNFQSLIFTKYYDKILGLFPNFNVNNIRTYYNIDPTKKTIVYIGSIEWDLMDEKFNYKNKDNQLIAPIMIKQLAELKDKYNVIVRPHPFRVDSFKGDFKLHTSYIDFPSFRPYLEIADLIISPRAAGGVTSTYYYKTPLIILTPTKYHKSLAKNKGNVLSNKTAILLDENNYNIKKAVREAFRNTPENRQRIIERKKHFKKFFGCIDGYENYRNSIKMLKFINKELHSYKIENGIKQLEEEIKNFPIYDKFLC